MIEKSTSHIVIEIAGNKIPIKCDDVFDTMRFLKELKRNNPTAKYEIFHVTESARKITDGIELKLSLIDEENLVHPHL